MRSEQRHSTCSWFLTNLTRKHVFKTPAALSYFRCFRVCTKVMNLVAVFLRGKCEFLIPGTSVNLYNTCTFNAPLLGCPNSQSPERVPTRLPCPYFISGRLRQSESANRHHSSTTLPLQCVMVESVLVLAWGVTAVCACAILMYYSSRCSHFGTLFHGKMINTRINDEGASSVTIWIDMVPTDNPKPAT